MTQPYDPQYGQTGPGGQPYPGAQPYSGSQPGSGYGLPGPQPYSGAQPYPGAQPYAGSQAYPPTQPFPSVPGPGQPGFAAVNQLPGQALAEVARKRGMRQIFLGIGIFAIGLIITVLTFSAASSGGTYIVAYGPMILGVIWAIRGITTVSRANKLR